jgi:hypothetical protein
VTVRAWLQTWLAARRGPAPLRQSAWCANGLHPTCTGYRMAQDAVVDCLCPCHALVPS